MLIKIIKNTTKPFHELVWYADRVGSFFKVNSESEAYFFVYHGAGNEENNIGAINKIDCKIIQYGKIKV